MHAARAGGECAKDGADLARVRVRVRVRVRDENTRTLALALALALTPTPTLTKGSLRVSVAVIGGTVEPPTHTLEEEAEAREDDNPLVLMPHLVRWTYYSLFVAIYRVEGLPNMDEHGATDAFVSVKFHGQVRARPRARASGRGRGRVRVRVRVRVRTLTQVECHLLTLTLSQVECYSFCAASPAPCVACAPHPKP